MALLSQIGAVTSMNIASLRQRVGPSLATVVAVALVTGVLLGFVSRSDILRAVVTDPPLSMWR